MEEALEHFVQGLPTILLFVVIGVSLLVLGKAADWLVDEAVLLSERSGIPKTIIGATIVSLGTTAPEAAVSVFAAIQGQPGLALGNAVGSIICDTGLILGVACLIAPLKLDRTIVNRQGWIQLGAAVAMVAFCFPLEFAGQRLHRRRQSRPMGWLRVPRRVGRLYLAIDSMGRCGLRQLRRHSRGTRLG